MGFLRWIKPFMTLGLSLVVPYIASRIRTSNDIRRAQLLEVIADGVIAELLALYPDADWVTLIETAVDVLRTAVPSIPTKNVDVLRRAASAALAKHGIKSPVAAAE